MLESLCISRNRKETTLCRNSSFWDDPNLYVKIRVFRLWRKIMNWIYLIIAGLLEIGWAIGLKYTEGWTKLLPSVLTGLTMLASFYFLSLALKTLPIGTAYAVWTGIGTVGAAILGMTLFNEPRDFARILCILLIIGGIAGLKLTSAQ